ncbi:hypothetical protein DRQ33_01660, partial [bacterium]
LNKRLEELQEILNNMLGGKAGKGYRMEVPISSKAAGNLSVRVRYVVFDSKWTPGYDARYQENTGKVKFTYFGSITQRTGEDWNNCNVILSTAQPQLGMEPSPLSIWYLRKYEPKREMYEMKSALAPAKASGAELIAYDAEEAEYDLATASIVGENVIFQVPGLKDIPADGQTHKVVITELEFDADKKFLTIPKRNQKVYLMAKFKNNSDFLFLPGEISVFQGNDFVGTQYLHNPIAFDEEIRLAMGPVQTIKVNRKRVKEFSEKTGIFGQNKREFFAFDIKISNNSKSTVNIEVVDHIPVSTHEKITVEDVKFEPQPNERDKDFEGQIIWELQIPKGTEKILRYQFGVKYPKDMMIQGL